MPLNDLSSLNLRLNRRVNKMEDRVNRNVRDAVVGAHRVIASGTPVDTGQARSNWRGFSGLNAPSNVIEPYAPGEKLGISETANLEAANAQVRRAAMNWKPSSGKRFLIFNNWPLISDLNAGTISKQGSFFIEAGIAFWGSRIRAIRGWMSRTGN